jgi:hypothetical protein
MYHPLLHGLLWLYCVIAGHDWYPRGGFLDGDACSRCGMLTFEG